jgi:hypothetical protein
MNGTKYYMKDEVAFQDYPSYSEKTGGKKPMVAFIVVLLIIAGVIAGLFFLGRNQGSDQDGISAAPTDRVSVPTIEVDPTPTVEPTPDLDRVDLSIEVLNGSGATGAAGDMADTLRELGYKISSTGNADRSDYKGITINISEKNKEFITLLEADLKEAAGASVTSSVSASLTSGARVIVGK